MKVSVGSSITIATTSSYYLPFCHRIPYLPLRSNLLSTFQSNKHPSLRNPKLSFAINERLAFPTFSRCPTRASMSSPTQSTGTKPFSVLFVCLGNICRSPAAEGVFRDIVTKKGLDSKFNIDSAGTIDYHEGNLADSRMRAAAKRRGIEITSTSRPIRSSDFRDFDLILAMDEQNREDILKAFNVWKVRENVPADGDKKVKLMCSYCKKHDDTEVPDPYYGGAQGFEKVLDLLEDACDSLLESILAENGS